MCAKKAFTFLGPLIALFLVYIYYIQLYVRKQFFRAIGRSENPGGGTNVVEIGLSDTRCASHFENLTNFKILKEPLLVQKQTLYQQKVLNLSFNMAS